MGRIGSIFNPGPRGKVRWLVFLILLLVLLAGFLDYPVYYNRGVDWLNPKLGQVKMGWFKVPRFPEMTFHLGLDLKGGTHLIYEADLSQIDPKERGSAMEGVRDVIERRVNAFGVAEPEVRIAGPDNDRLNVELAGIKDVKQAIAMIGETPILEFKTQNTEIQLLPEQQEEMKVINDKARTDSTEALRRVKAGEDWQQLVNEYSQDSEEIKSQGGSLDYITKDGPYREVWALADQENLEPGDLHEHIFNSSDGFQVVRIDDKRQSENKEVKARHILICYQGMERCEEDYSEEEARQKIEELKLEANKDNFADLAKEHSTGPSAEQGGDLGWFGKGKMVPEFEEPAFNMSVGEISDIVETSFGLHIIYKEEERQENEYKASRIFFKTKSNSDYIDDSQPEWENTELSGKHLERSLVQFDPNTNEPEVSIEFNDEGKELFAALTADNVGKPIAIFLDGFPISIPTVQDVIKQGKARITGEFNIIEAKKLAQRLNAGALPVPINLISQNTVGATLGQDSLNKSLIAGAAGLFLVILFMIFYYRLPGLLASLALISYGILILAIFKLGSITLTLSGIAGFILSLGLAVDANVLIFERIKEELRTDKTIGAAIDEGFHRAWPSIRDGNLSTLITCFILIMFTSGTVQGFAVTLFVGILASMFSALIITKTFLKLTTRWFKGGWWYGVKKILGEEN